MLGERLDLKKLFLVLLLLSRAQDRDMLNVTTIIITRITGQIPASRLST